MLLPWEAIPLAQLEHPFPLELTEGVCVFGWGEGGERERGRPGCVSE